MAKKTSISPRGIAEPYCYLTKPDYGKDDFKNDRGLYKVSLTVPADDPKVQKIIDEIMEKHTENYEKLLEEYEKNPPKVQKGKKPIEPYEGDMPFFHNDDGTVTFNFKGYASYIDKKDPEGKKLIPIRLDIVDGTGKPIKDCPNISGGSEMKVKFSLVPYGWSKVAGASVKLQLEGIMLLKAVEYGAGGGWDDETEEDGEDYSNRGRDSSYDDDDDSRNSSGEREGINESDDDGDY